MKNWNPFVIVIFVLLLLAQVLDIQADCTWDPDDVQKYCTISCKSNNGFETTVQILADLDQKLRVERTQCNVEGINLTLGDMMFPDFLVTANWFTPQVKVNELSMDFLRVTQVEINAFNVTAFKFVKRLVLQTFKLEIIRKGMFNGLESLEVLNLKDAALLRTVNNGVLDVLNQTLKKFTLEQSYKQYTNIVINGFTGSDEMPMLEEVKYFYNLGDTISNKSFVGLRNVKKLDLSECGITAIGPGSFDPISSSIEILNLNNNEITKLPEGIFNLMLPSDVTSIYLTGHQWHCDCDLMHFKLSLMEYTNFIGTFRCNNQPHRGNDIIESDFCDSYVPPTTTTTDMTTTTSMISPTTQQTSTMPTSTIESSTETSTSPPIETSTSPPTTETSTEPIAEFSQECFEQGETEAPKRIAIKTPNSIMSINEDDNGDVIIQVDSLSENSVLIWFSLNDGTTYLSTNSEINCRIAGEQNQKTSMSIDNLKENTAYTFCLMDSTEKTVSPLDCISYTKQYDTSEVPWIFDKSKSLVISMVVVACSFSVFAGLAIGILSMRANEILKNKRHRSGQVNNVSIADVLKETFQSNSMMRQRSGKFSETRDSCNTRRTTNTTLDYYAENTRPLPRPPLMQPYEEPIYATVS